jgi:hypothetical protein
MSDPRAIDIIKECRAALAEELSAWDIDPPLHHVKQAHDKCVAWLAAQPSAEPSAWECKAGGLKPLSQRLYDKQPDAIKQHYTRIQPPSELVWAARDAVERYEARQHGLRDLHPDDREAFDEAIDALRRALDAPEAKGGGR